MTEHSIDLQGIPSYQKRKFVPENVCLSNREEIINLYKKLLIREVRSQEELEAWLEDRSELDAAFDQVGTILYIQMTCQTDHSEKAEAYKEFIQSIIPAVKPFIDQLNKKYLSLCKQFPLNSRYYEIYDQTIQTDVELFRDKNIVLQTKIDLLSQQYQTVCGAMTVEYQGKSRTLAEMGKFLLEPDRTIRETAWRLIAQRRLKDKEALERIFSEMLFARNQIAHNADCPNFSDYQFRVYHRFDYTPLECRQYHQSIKNLVLPLWKTVLERRQKNLGLKELRPWDLQVDPMGHSPLKPFQEVGDLMTKVHQIFLKLDANLGAQFKEMMNLRLLDLASRKGKAPGGYQSTLAEARKPFIFMNAVGIDQDVKTLLHEGGHAFHALAAAGQRLYLYRHAPMEFCEIASMSMELLGEEQLDVFYNDHDIKRSRLNHFEDIIEILIWVALIDAFQFWIYEHPAHSPEERKKVWLTLYQEFNGDGVDWSGIEEEKAYLWHRQLHIFEVPFYYIEYGIAQLGALQLWLNYKKNPQKTLNSYRESLILGGSQGLPELFQTAGIHFDFSEKTIAPLISAVNKELERLSV